MSTQIASAVDVSLLLERGKQLVEYEQRKREEDERQAEALRVARMRQLWEPHYQALCDLGLGELVPCAPLPTVPPYFGNTYDGTACNPLTITVPGVGVVHFYHWHHTGHGTFAAPRPERYEDEDGIQHTYYHATHPSPYELKLHGAPTLDDFARALYEAREIAEQNELVPA